MFSRERVLLEGKDFLGDREVEHNPCGEFKVVKSLRVDEEGKGSFKPLFGGWSGWVKVRGGSLRWRCQAQVQTYTPLSVVKGQALEKAFELSSSPLSLVVSLL